MEELIIGIDDAGRGPIIGPMVLAGILIKKSQEERLKNWGVKDSKLLMSKKRTEIAQNLLENFETHVELTSVEEIDSRTKMGTNLNRIEAIKTAKIINFLIEKIQEPVGKIKIIVDCPSTNILDWENYLKKYIDNLDIVQLFVEHKADFNHLSCAAASIVAKHTREIEIAKIKKVLGIDFGSGYCSDPLTQEFLEKNADRFKDLNIIRTSWDTWDKLIAKKEQKALGDF
ncbi:MAG: ribonuclease HII [Nanoarchaeota archaeon]